MFSNTNNVVFATGNDTTGEYNFTYPIQKSDDIIVKVRKISDGVISTLTETTDYSVTINGINGGKINFIDNGQDWLDVSGNLTSDYEVMIKRLPFINQTSDFRNAGPYFAELHEDRFDRQTYFDQGLKEALDRAAKFDEFVQYNLPGTYPSLPRPEANKYLKWHPDEDGTLINDEYVVDLSNYYTKSEVDALDQGLQNQIDNITGSLVSSVNTRTGDVVLDASDVGLDQVDNTSDLDKPVSTATQLALDDKLTTANLTAGSNVTITGSGTDVDPLVVNASGGISSVDWGDIGGTLSDQTDLQSALSSKEDTITAGTTSQYYRGDKTFQTLNAAAVGLGNVDNTSDLNKPISTATQAALNDKLDTADAYRDSMVQSLEIDFNSATQHTSIASNVTYTMVNVANGRTTVLSVNNIDSVARTVTFPSGIKARADINYSVEPGETNIYTFVRTGGVTYVACVDGLV